MRHRLVLAAIALCIGACNSNKERAVGPYALSGQVVNELGLPVAGAKLTVGGTSVAADAQGRFAARLAQAPANFVPVNVAASGYVGKSVRLTVLDVPPPPLTVTLRQIGLTTQITMPQPGDPPAVVTLQAQDTTHRLSFCVGSLLHGDGSAVLGQVTVHLTGWSCGEAMTSAPGPLAALSGSASSCAGLGSLGMINFDAEQNGSPLQVAGGSSVLWQCTLPPCAQTLISSLSGVLANTGLYGLDTSQCAFNKQSTYGATTGVVYGSTGSYTSTSTTGATSGAYASTSGTTDGGTTGTTGGGTTSYATTGGGSTSATGGSATTGTGGTTDGGTTGYASTTGAASTTGYTATTGGTTGGMGGGYGAGTQVCYDSNTGVMQAPVPATGTWNYDYVCNQAGGCMTTANGGCVQGMAYDCGGKPLANQNINLWLMGRSNMLQGGGNFGVMKFLATTDSSGHYCKTVGIEPPGYGDAAASVPIYVSGTDSPLMSNAKCPLAPTCQVCDQTDPLCNTCANGSPNGVLSADAVSYNVQRGQFCGTPGASCTQLNDAYIGTACQQVGACPQGQTYPVAHPCDVNMVPNACCGDPLKTMCSDGVCVPRVGGGESY